MRRCSRITNDSSPNPYKVRLADHPLGIIRPNWRTAIIRQLDLSERCPRMTCSTSSSPNRLVKGAERNKKR